MWHFVDLLTFRLTGDALLCTDKTRCAICRSMDPHEVVKIVFPNFYPILAIFPGFFY